MGVFSRHGKMFFGSDLIQIILTRGKSNANAAHAESTQMTRAMQWQRERNFEPHLDL